MSFWDLTDMNFSCDILEEKMGLKEWVLMAMALTTESITFTNGILVKINKSDLICSSQTIVLDRKKKTLSTALHKKILCKHRN